MPRAAAADLRLVIAGEQRRRRRTRIGREILFEKAARIAVRLRRRPSASPPPCRHSRRRPSAPRRLGGQDGAAAPEGGQRRRRDPLLASREDRRKRARVRRSGGGWVSHQPAQRRQQKRAEQPERQACGIPGSIAARSPPGSSWDRRRQIWRAKVQTSVTSRWTFAGDRQANWAREGDRDLGGLARQRGARRCARRSARQGFGRRAPCRGPRCRRRRRHRRPSDRSGCRLARSPSAKAFTIRS